MNPFERRAATGLASIFGLRMFGLFLILPVFSIYGADLAGATPALIGLAIGIYGLTQALLQIPMGIASDHFGRKRVILAGLLVFVVGSVLAAVSDHILGIIAGRALQGAGAIAAAVLALAADLTAPQRRTRTMAVIGMSVGASFMLALVMGPILGARFGLAALFWVPAVLGVAAIAVLYLLVPNPEVERPHADAEPMPGHIFDVLRNRDLLRLDSGIFCLHLILTATFIAVPVVLHQQMGLPVDRHWMVYVPVLLLSVVGLVPAIILGERYGAQRLVFRLAVLTMVVASSGLALLLDMGSSVLLALWLYFVAFNILEATLPSFVSRYAPPAYKGTALGVYATFQFLGAFAGGVLGGIVLGTAGTGGVFLLCAGVALVWLVGASALGRIPEAGVAPAAESVGYERRAPSAE